MHFNHILVTTDFSVDSKTAFELAAYESKMEGTRITLFHAVDDWNVPPGFEKAVPLPGAIEQYRKELLSHAEENLDALASEYFHQQNVETKALLSEKEPAQQIIEFAESEQCDLIIMCSHGRGKFKSALMGSTALKVMNGSDCPVMIVPRRS